MPEVLKNISDPSKKEFHDQRYLILANLRRPTRILQLREAVSMSDEKLNRFIVSMLDEKLIKHNLPEIGEPYLTITMEGTAKLLEYESRT